MDTTINEIYFESPDDSPKSTVEIPSEVPEEHVGIMTQFLQSGYTDCKGLYINRFLEPDKTIDLERLELALLLLIEYQEFSDKSGERIYVFLKNMDAYLKERSILATDIERITEESHFILGFCRAVADEYCIIRPVEVLFSEVGDGTQ